MTEFGIHHRLESCAGLYRKWKIMNHDWPKKAKKKSGALLWHYLLVRTKIDPWARKYFTSLLATCFLIYADCIHEAIYYLRSYPPFPCQWQKNLSLTRIFSLSDWINMTRTNYLSQTPVVYFLLSDCISQPLGKFSGFLEASITFDGMGRPREFRKFRKTHLENILPRGSRDRDPR